MSDTPSNKATKLRELRRDLGGVEGAYQEVLRRLMGGKA